MGLFFSAREAHHFIICLLSFSLTQAVTVDTSFPSLKHQNMATNYNLAISTFYGSENVHTLIEGFVFTC